MIKKVIISKSELKRLYLKEKLSAREIAKRLNCAKSAIQNKMKKYGIPARNNSEALRLVPRQSKYKISKKKLVNLYEKQKLSTHQIAKRYGCSGSIISSKLKKYGIKTRNVSEGIKLTNNERLKAISKAVSKYAKKDFDGADIEKAYLIGFRLGDLNAYKKDYGETIYIQCGTTRIEQLILMNELFKNYGHVLIRRGKEGNFHFVCNLNNSFDFLLKKRDEIEKWILDDDNCFLSFLGGYIDAEGSFGVYNGFGSFFVGSYDKNIIRHIYSRLKSFGIKSESPRINVKAGYIDKRGVKTLKDLWGVKIRRKEDLYKFINLIKPHVKHLKRVKDMKAIEINNIIKLSDFTGD